MGFESSEIARKTFEKAIISNFAFPSDAVRAIEIASIYQERIRNNESLKEGAISKNEKRVNNSKKIFSKALADKNRNVFFYEEALALVEPYGLNAVYFKDVTDDESFLEEIDYPVVAKIDSPKLLHKNSKNGLELGLTDSNIARKAIQRLKADFPNEKIILQPQVESGLEIIFGIKKDPNFGAVFMCGLGGILTEIFNEKMIWFLPVSVNKIKKDLETSRVGEIINKQGVDIKVVAGEAEKVAQLGFENEWIKELDVNPIIFYKDKNPISVDIKVIGADNN
jgi:acyl-CoA synthetase (NDP forming)